MKIKDIGSIILRKTFFVLNLVNSINLHVMQTQGINIFRITLVIEINRIQEFVQEGGGLIFFSLQRGGSAHVRTRNP